MKKIIADNFNSLKCIVCNEVNLLDKDEMLVCLNCEHTYPINDKGQLITSNDYIDAKKWELTSVNFNLFDSSYPISPNKINGPRISDLIDIYNINGLAINLGSGEDRHNGYLNVDLGNYENVDIVANLKKLPFSAGSVDLIASNSVLEHIYDYEKVIDEVYRVLSPGGYFYLCVPSLCIRHHEFDYHRWTIPALQKLFFGKFELIERGSCRGISYAFITFGDALINYKIRNKYLHKLFFNLWRFISKPLTWIKYDVGPEYEALSQTIYIIGKKS